MPVICYFADKIKMKIAETDRLVVLGLEYRFFETRTYSDSPLEDSDLGHADWDS